MLRGAWITPTMLEGIADPRGEKKIITRARLGLILLVRAFFFFSLPSVSSGWFEFTASEHVNK